ncbi:hypothetical protein [Halomonas sp. E19]|uniref:hypothetical protein n=1 Tax=Halomonas sp. E19 TaxID=3397247 RepID=UPI004034C975
MTIDGRDPAAFAWAIISAEEELAAQAEALREGHGHYPLRLPYVIAETVKGYGFPGAGTNAAHNLPLGQNPADDAAARKRFNAGAAALFVPTDELRAALAELNDHALSGRPKEREHPWPSPRWPCPSCRRPATTPSGRRSPPWPPSIRCSASWWRPTRSCACAWATPTRCAATD